MPLDWCMLKCSMVDLFDICLFSTSVLFEIAQKSLEAMQFLLNQKSKELSLAKAARKRERKLASKILTGNNNNGDEKILVMPFDEPGCSSLTKHVPLELLQPTKPAS